MKYLILGTVICLMGAFASTDTGITSKRDPRFFFGLRQVLKQDDKRALIQQLRNEISVLRALVTALQPLIARNAARCPTTAVGARRIGNFCYTVTTTPTEFAAASRECLSMGGYLAEPTLTANGLADFAEDINTVFSPGITTAHIGLVETDFNSEVFQYLQSGTLIAEVDALPLFNNVAFDDDNTDAAILAISAGTPLTTAVDTAGDYVFTTLAPSICQYDLVN